MRANRLRWLHLFATNPPQVRLWKGIRHLGRWFVKHGLLEHDQKSGKTLVTDKGRASLKTAIAEYDAHGRLSEALPMRGW